MHVAIITGVSRGLGEALAIDLLQRGHTVLGIGRSASARLTGPLYRHATCDLSMPTQIESAVLRPMRDLAGERLVAVTLINNAAVATPIGRVGRLDAREIEAACATNIAAPLVLTDLFLRAFPDSVAQRRVINISSGSAQKAIAGSAPYSMGKAAIEMLTHSVVVDHLGSSLECITLRPGIFETKMQQLMRNGDSADFPSVALFRGFKEQGLLEDPAEVARRIVEKLVLGPVDNGRTYLHTDLD